MERSAGGKRSMVSRSVGGLRRIAMRKRSPHPGAGDEGTTRARTTGERAHGHSLNALESAETRYVGSNLLTHFRWVN